jgi:hypothetical protein
MSLSVPPQECPAVPLSQPTGWLVLRLREIWHKSRMNQFMDNCDHDELSELIDPPVIIGAVLYIAAMVCLTLVLSALGS